jgi:8-oxo-dGTP diphosphatase
MPLEDYPRPSVTVDVIIFTLRGDDLQASLIKRKHPPFEGMWAMPGGFVSIGESLERAALRELEEETGVRDVYLEQLYTFGWCQPTPSTSMPATTLPKPAGGPCTIYRRSPLTMPVF